MEKYIIPDDERDLVHTALEHAVEDIRLTTNSKVIDRVLNKSQEAKNELYQLLGSERVTCEDEVPEDWEEETIEGQDDIHSLLKDRIMREFESWSVTVENSRTVEALKNIVGADSPMFGLSSDFGEAELSYHADTDKVEVSQVYRFRMATLLLNIIDVTPAEELKQNKLATGMKINKFVKTLLEPGSHEGFDIVWSRVIQVIKNVSKPGKNLVISVAPIDYLFQSEASDWESCHRISGRHNSFGERGNAGYSMMLDSVTLVAYRNKDTNFKRCGITYPDKSWRQLIHVDFNNKSIQFGRQYPSANMNNHKVIRHKLNHLFSEYMFNERRGWKVSKGKVGDIRTHRFPYEDLCGNPSSASYTVLKDETAGPPDLRYGEDIFCLDCGDTYDIPLEVPLCGSCGGGDEEMRCEECGYRHHEDDMRYTGDMALCADCFIELFFSCDDCDDVRPREESTEVINGHGRSIDVGDCCLRFYRECDCCGYLVWEDDIADAEDTNGIIELCSNCMVDHTVSCDECGVNVHRDVTEGLHRGVALCEDCYKDYNTEEEVV